MEYDEDYAEAVREARAQARRERREAEKRAEEIRADLRSAAARKGWETRRAGKRRADYVARTMAEREELKTRKRRKSRLDIELVPDAIKYDASKLKPSDLEAIVLNMKERGVTAMRFVRQVPPTPNYPTGVASTRWMNIQKSSVKTIKQLLGGMMQPGIDYVKTFYTLNSDIPKLDPGLRQVVLDAIKH